MAISIGDAVLKLGIDTKAMEKGLKGLQSKIQKHHKAIGLGMVAAGGVILGGLAMSMKAAADFEGAMREVNTMMGLSQDEFTAFSKDVQALASDLGVDAVESAKALYQAISAGVPKENVLEFLEIATKAAIGGVTDTATAVDGLTTVINAFKLPMSDAQKVADIMFTTVKGGKTTFEELSASLFQVAPIAAASGVRFEEIAAALATMTKQGVPTTVATTQLRQAMVALQKPTADMNKIIQELGYESGQTMLEELGLAKTLNKLRDATGGSNEMLMKMFGSVEAGQAVLSLTGKNAAMFTADLEAMEKATGAATDAFNEMEKSASRQMARLKSSFKDISMTVGNILLPILTDLLNMVKPVIESIKNWADAHPELTRVLVITTGAISAFMVVLGPVLIALPAIIKAFAAMRTFLLTSLIPSIIRTTAALWGKVQALYAAMVAMGPKGWAMAAASMAIMTAGLVAITIQAKRSIESFTGEVKKYTPRAREADRITREWGESLSKLDTVTRRITESENKLVAVEEKLREQSRGLANVRAFLIGEGESLIDILKREALATEGITQADEDYVDVLLRKSELNKEELRYLRDYKWAKEQALEVEREHREEIKETNLLLEEEAIRLIELDDAMDGVADSWDRFLKDTKKSTKAFREYGLTAEDVVRFLATKWGMTFEEAVLHMELMQISVSDVKYNLDELGITAYEVAKYVDKLGDELEEAGKKADKSTESLEKYEKAIKKALEISPTQAAAGARMMTFAPWEVAAQAASMARQGYNPAQIAFATGEMAAGIPTYQEGGIAMRPMLASVAEKGPEAVIPLDRDTLERLGIGGYRTANITWIVDGRVLARIVEQPLVDDLRLKTGARF